MVKNIIYSLVTTLATAVLGFLLATVMPQPIMEDGQQNETYAEVTKRFYTPEELDKAAKKMNEEIKEQLIKESKKTQLELYQSFRHAGVWLSWIPWIILPFFISLKNYRAAVLLLITPVIFTLANLLLPLELLLCSLGLIIGVFIKNQMINRQRNN